MKRKISSSNFRMEFKAFLVVLNLKFPVELKKFLKTDLKLLFKERKIV